MSNITNKWNIRVYVFCVLALFAASSAWAEPQVPPFDGVLASVYDYLDRVWKFLVDLVG